MSSRIRGLCPTRGQGIVRARAGRATVLLAVAFHWLALPALAARVEVDPPPQPSAGSKADVGPPGRPNWIELDDPIPTADLPPLVRSDAAADAGLSPLEEFVTPPPVVQWDAITQTLATGVRPPDDDVAAGPGAGAAGRVVEVTNQSVQIFNKLGATVAGPIPLATMFPPAPGTFVFDPKVLFDQHSGRFMIVVLEVGFSGMTCTSALLSNRIRVAVSTTGTPNTTTAADWIFLAGPGLMVIGGATTWADYPSIGADSDSLFITTNQFDAACTFRGANVRVYNKALLLAGIHSAVDVTFNAAVTPGVSTIQPGHVYGATDNGGFYLISRFGPGTYRIFNIMGDPAAPAATTGLFAWVAGAFPADTSADQCTVAAPDIDTLAVRLQNAVYRNGRMWSTHTSDPDGDGQTEVVWHQIATNSFPSAAPTVAQSGFINGSGTPSPWTYMPSIDVNSGGDAAISYMQSSATQCPRVMAAIRLNADPPGTFQTPALARASAGFYDSVSGAAIDRWGDYSGTAVDPTDQCFWIVNEFSAATAVNASRWGTHIAKFCTATEGACCFGPRVCGMRTPANCASQGGSFRGLGTKCPTQNVQTALHQNGPIVHWVDPALNCNNIVFQGLQGSDCCTPHPSPGCDTPSCAANVCQVLPHCCQVFWDQSCADFAQQVCPGLCESSGCNPLAPVDAWVTSNEPGEQTCDPLMIGPFFFGPGSDPFIGTVCYQGEPLGATPFGTFDVADTLVQRPAGDPFDRCAIPGYEIDIPIEIVALNLTSISPIQVTFNGGTIIQFWDVQLNLSNVRPPFGQMHVSKTHCNGGTWTSALPVQAKFTFTQVGNPSNFRILDTGVDGDPPIILQTVDLMPWVSDADPNFHFDGPVCTDFHPGIQDPSQSTDCDCNLNGVRDDCDVDTGGYSDCNRNQRPDECDPDLDLDLAPDDCDNCPQLFNPSQSNADLDRYGDQCDLCPVLTERTEGDHDGDKIRQIPNEDLPQGDNCPCVSNYTQQDTDGDGTGDACELAPAGDVQLTLLVTKDFGGSIKLDWGDSCRVTDDDYAVYEGTVGGTFTTHLPRACSTLGATQIILFPPAVDVYYLIVPTSAGAVEGSYGMRTVGPRPPSGAACLPQSVGPCP